MVVVAAPDIADRVVAVEVVFAGLGRVDIVGSVFVGAVVVGAVVVGLGKIGTADVDRHRWVVPWPLSYTADQRVVGFLNSRSCLGWSNYIVGELFLDRQVLETCSHWWVDRWNHSTMQRVLHLWQNSSCLEGSSNSLFYIRQRE